MRHRKNKKSEEYIWPLLYHASATLQLKYYESTFPLSLYSLNKSQAFKPGAILKYSFTPPEDTLFSLFKTRPDRSNKAPSLSELSAEAQQTARECLNWWQETSTLGFNEVTVNPHFYLFNNQLNLAPTFAYSPLGKWLLDPGFNFISINENYIQDESATPFLMQTILCHEIGHAGFALRHPFEKSIKYNFEGTTYHSIMNYVNIKLDNIVRIPITPMPSDIDKAHFIYGKNLLSGAGNNVYYIEKFTKPIADPGWTTIASLPWDAAGIDTLSSEHVNGNALLDIRRYGLSSIDSGYVWTPNVVIENIISGNGEHVIYLNEFANYVDISASKSTHLHVNPYFNGNDNIVGFKPESDQISLHYDAQVYPSPMYTLKVKYHICPDKIICLDTTIQFENNHSIVLSDIDLTSEIKISTVERQVPEHSQVNSFAIDKLDQHFKEYLKALPIQLGEDFLNAFLMGTALTFISELNDEILKFYKCTTFQRQMAGILLHSLYISYTLYSYQDNTLFLTNYVLNHVLSTQNLYDRYLMKYSITPQLTVTGLLSHAVAISGHYAGNRFTLWAKKKAEQFFSSDPSPTCDRNKEYPAKHQPLLPR